VLNHQVSVEWEAYGYSAAVNQAFQTLHGRDLRQDGSDEAALRSLRGACYSDIIRRAQAVCRGAGIPLGLQLTGDLYPSGSAAGTMGIDFDWRGWIAGGLADQMLTKYISPYSPIFRDIHGACEAAGVPLYVEFERFFGHPEAPAIYRHYFDSARAAGALAINLYEGANLAFIDEEGTTRSKHPLFEQFMTGYAARHARPELRVLQ
jgi:hypothetical protein